ncbi:hypothetical protein DFH08DRAFT_684361, partial [Mycena albidolilacea]
DPAPPNVRIVPCSVLDMWAQDRVLTLGLVVDTSLEPQALERSLSMLAVRKFPRAGPRLTERNWDMEFQIPCTFDSNHPPIAFTAHHYREPYSSLARPDVRALVSSSDSEPLLCPLPSLEMYLRSKECPKYFADFLASDTPILNVHVSVFDDLTIIGVTFPQTMFDVPGMRTLLHGWMRVLSGEDIDAIQGMEWDVAPFGSFRDMGVYTVYVGMDLASPSSALTAHLFFSACGCDAEEGMLIRVPKAYLEDRRCEIMGHLKLQGSSERVETSDILMAWWLKTSYDHRKSDDETPIWIHISVDLRTKRIFSGASTLSEQYINNASSAVLIPPISANGFQKASLGELALRIRRAIAAYDADPTGIRHELGWLNANIIMEHLPSPRGAESETQTNWCDARLSELDFSGARALGSKDGTGRVLLVLADMLLEEHMPARGNGAILMEDEKAFWMSQVKGRKEWEKIRLSGRVNFI